MLIEQIIDSVLPLPASSKATLTGHIKEVSFKKGHLIIKANKIDQNIYFIKKGLVRAFADIGESEVTFWIGKEGATIISMRSYVEHKEGYEHIELLEDCELYQLEGTILQELFLADIHIANWGRKFAELELIHTEERLISRQFKTATERYKDLLQNNPDFLQRVQLNVIASYLGITQVSLSRIRADVRC
ncbi:MAG: cyclic nucleotide-binding protein [Bacteroidetes bacterium 43-16]|nr:MAG: cyclic nucleotide-binding protein [Bacteroidetes bacterium 43-16]